MTWESPSRLSERRLEVDELSGARHSQGRSCHARPPRATIVHVPTPFVDAGWTSERQIHRRTGLKRDITPPKRLVFTRDFLSKPTPGLEPGTPSSSETPEGLTGDHARRPAATNDLQMWLFGESLEEQP
jgi:hypothetical protein